MKKFSLNMFLLLLIFSNLILSNLNFPSFIGYWDEILELIIIILGLVYIIFQNKTSFQKKNFLIVLSIVAVVIIGILGNLCFGYVNSANAIIRDIIAFIKFPLVLLIIIQLNYDSMFNYSLTNWFYSLIKIIVIIMFIFGIISIFKDIGLSQNEIRYGIKPYQFLFSHPTYLVLTSLFLLLLIDSIGYQKNKKNFIYQLMLLIIIILSMRTKGIIIAALFVFIKYAGKWLQRFKVLYWGGALGLAFFTAYDKLALYSSYSTSPRETLYRGSFLLLKKCFPLGSGFATFASHISGKFNSAVYDFIKIPYYWTGLGNEMNVLGDAGFAYYIGQFGLIGFVIFIYILYKLYKLTLVGVKNKLPIIIMWIYIIVALTSESILSNNGIEIAFMLAYLSSLNKQNNNLKRSNKI